MIISVGFVNFHNNPSLFLPFQPDRLINRGCPSRPIGHPHLPRLDPKLPQQLSRTRSRRRRRTRLSHRVPSPSGRGRRSRAGRRGAERSQRRGATTGRIAGVGGVGRPFDLGGHAEGKPQKTCRVVLFGIRSQHHS